jgi:putative colanic acid biosynthesis acetyltransferase WcaF
MSNLVESIFDIFFRWSGTMTFSDGTTIFRKRWLRKRGLFTFDKNALWCRAGTRILTENVGGPFLAIVELTETNMSAPLDARDSSPLTGGPSFTLRNRIGRLAWMTVWKLFAAWTPPQMNGWRLFLLRLFGAKVSNTARIYSSVKIWSPSNIEVADFACIGPRVTVYSMAKISFGSYSLASQGAHICAGTHDIDDENFQLRAQPIVIGSRSWIAAEAFVGPGVIVGEGAVLGARGVTFRNLQPWSVNAGNPARRIRDRTRRHLTPNLG